MRDVSTPAAYEAACERIDELLEGVPTTLQNAEVCWLSILLRQHREHMARWAPPPDTEASDDDDDSPELIFRKPSMAEYEAHRYRPATTPPGSSTIISLSVSPTRKMRAMLLLAGFRPEEFTSLEWRKESPEIPEDIWSELPSHGGSISHER